MESRTLWRWFFHIRCDSWSIYTIEVHVLRNVFHDCDDSSLVIERSQLEQLVMDYCRVEFVRMYPPLPFQYIPASLGRSLTRKWIRQMLPCRPHHVGAPIRNPVRYSMVSLLVFLLDQIGIEGLWLDFQNFCKHFRTSRPWFLVVNLIRALEVCTYHDWILLNRWDQIFFTKCETPVRGILKPQCCLKY